MAATAFTDWVQDGGESPTINLIQRAFRHGFVNGELRSVQWKVLCGLLSPPVALESKHSKPKQSKEAPATAPQKPIATTKRVKSQFDSSTSSSDDDDTTRRKGAAPARRPVVETSDTTDSDSDEEQAWYDELFSRWIRESDAYRAKLNDWKETRFGNKNKPQPKGAEEGSEASPAKQKQQKASSSASASPKTTVATKAAPKPKFGDVNFGASSSSSSSESDSDDNDDPLADPLAVDTSAEEGAGSEWNTYFQNQKAMELVDKDLERLSLGYEDFFEMPERRAELREVLQAALELGVIVDYCQGMHEIVGIFAWVLWQDAEAVEDLPIRNPARPALRTVCEKGHIKHDVLAFLGVLMQSMNMNEWFEADCSKPAPGQRRREDNTPLFQLLKRLQLEILPKHSPELANHLTKKLDIPPVVYGVRWLRLLFIREFTLSQMCKIWDALFAEYFMTKKTLTNSLAKDIALAMLLFLGPDIVQKDYNEALRRCMKFPPVEDTKLFIHSAVRTHYGSNSEIGELCGLLPERTAPPPRKQVEETSFTNTANPDAFAAVSSPTSSTPHADPNAVANAFKSQDPLAAVRASNPIITGATASTSGGVPVVQASSPQPVAHQPASASLHQLSQVWAGRSGAGSFGGGAGGGSDAAHQLRQQQERLGKRLDDVVSKLNNRWFPPATASAGEGGAQPQQTDDNAYILAIAELKRIRDVLMGGVEE